MPTYGFRCRVCGAETDLALPIASRDDPQSCPLCEGPLERLIEMPSVHIARVHRAVNHDESSFAEHCFKQPNAMNPGGMSDEEMVKKGLAKTRACSSWWGDSRPAQVAIGDPSRRKDHTPSPEIAQRVGKAIRDAVGKRRRA